MIKLYIIKKQEGEKILPESLKVSGEILNLQRVLITCIQHLLWSQGKNLNLNETIFTETKIKLKLKIQTWAKTRIREIEIKIKLKYLYKTQIKRIP